jgi:hypothetical protein
MLKIRLHHITLSGLLLGSLWTGVGYLVNHDRQREEIQRSSEKMKASFCSIDPWLMRASFFERIDCGIRGDCVNCHTTRDKIFTVDCGNRLGFDFGELLRAGFLSIARPKIVISWGYRQLPSPCCSC